ncbi:hypothetical protein SPURM210S_01561 [Streptomyces purpurascens]
MAKFKDVHHSMKGITEEQLREAHNADLAIEGDERVHFEAAWADPEFGLVYCLSEAPSAEPSSAFTSAPGTRPTRSIRCRCRSR